MFYLVYKTKSLLTGKYYIGAHQTSNLNDGYLGSGKLINRAIKKHGVENFIREILHFAESEDEMWMKEKELVVTMDEDPQSYNLTPGGNKPPRSKKGRKQNRPKFANGYDYIHKPETIEKIRKWTVENQPMHKPECKKKISEGRMGMKFSDSHVDNLRKSHQGMRWKLDPETGKRVWWRE